MTRNYCDVGKKIPDLSTDFVVLDLRNVIILVHSVVQSDLDVVALLLVDTLLLDTLSLMY